MSSAKARLNLEYFQEKVQTRVARSVFMRHKNYSVTFQLLGNQYLIFIVDAKPKNLTFRLWLFLEVSERQHSKAS